MVKSSELRIGNRFVRELHNRRGLEYDHDFVLTEEWMGKLFGIDISISLNDLFPIPLTNEIIEQFKSVYPNKMPNNLDIVFFHGSFVVETIDSKEIVCIIDFVHELQNLYYLCNREEFKLK